MALRIEKAFGVKMETLLSMRAWRDAYTVRQREDEIAVNPYRPSTPEHADELGQPSQPTATPASNTAPMKAR
jgi:plasmid maintenance system antidote protein VapI